MASERFVIDVRDPDDLRAKRPAAAREAQKWQDVVRLIDTILESEPEPVKQSEPNGHAEVGAPAVQHEDATPAEFTQAIAQLVEEVVNRRNRPIQSREVREILRREGHDLSAASVYNSLRYVAVRAKRIQHLPGRGIFAPMSYRPEELPGPTLNGSSTAAAQASPAEPTNAPPGRESVG